MTQTKRKIFFDISTVARWSGPVVGIIRVEREYALWFKSNVPDVCFVYYDASSQSYRKVRTGLESPILKGELGLDHWDLSVPQRTTPRLIDRVPKVARTPLIWFLQFRRQLLLQLEYRRFIATRRWQIQAIEALQRPLMSDKYKALMTTKDGRRRPYLKASSVLGSKIDPRPGDILLEVGNGWQNSDIEYIRRLKSQHGVRFVLMIQDLIPITFAHFYKAPDAAIFRNYMDAALPLADLILTTTRNTETDVITYAASQSLSLQRTKIAPLGADGPRAQDDVDGLTKHGLRRHGYALLVSTIEPRKGHAMILEVWRRLLKYGLPQKHNFKLVFVGRKGWLVDDLITELRQTTRETDSLVMLGQVSDEQLACLYHGAAFCLYPSKYEGYGLPIVEALQYGKPIVASNAGPMKELVANLSPSLDPDATELWESQLRSWIEDPEQLADIAAKIRRDYKPVSWAMSAESLAHLIETEFK